MISLNGDMKLLEHVGHHSPVFYQCNCMCSCSDGDILWSNTRCNGFCNPLMVGGGGVVTSAILALFVCIFYVKVGFVAEKPDLPQPNTLECLDISSSVQP